MIKIPDEIKEFIEKQGIFVIGTIGNNNIPNISPRIFFKIEDSVIYWLDFFKHKSFRNMQSNPWVTISVFNKDELKGFQFRGIINFITDEPIRSKMKKSIIEKTLEKNSSLKVKKIISREAHVVQFEPKVCYSLDPEEYTDMSIGSDIDSTQVF